MSEYIVDVRDGWTCNYIIWKDELIRCRDCKWFGDPGCAIKIVDASDRPTEMDFCSFAEPKEDKDGSD